jgi:Tol biopolymer transport system component
MLETLALAAAIATTAAQPAWSPDGTRIAYVGTVGPELRTDVFVTSIGTGATTDITADAPGQLHGQPAWSCDGRTVAYETNVSTPVTTRVVVSAVGADGTGRRDLTVTGAFGNVCCTAGDRTLVFDDFESVSTVRLDGSGRRPIAAAADSPVCSPDGRRVAFDGTSGVNNSDVFVTDANGAHRRRLTRARGGDRPLAWSRNGAEILFSSQRALYRDEHAGIGLFLETPAGKREHRVASGLPGDLFSATGDLSPDAKRVAYVSRTGALVVARADGRHARKLAASAHDPRWSPTGRWIVYATGGWIEIVRPDGSGRRVVGP